LKRVKREQGGEIRGWKGGVKEEKERVKAEGGGGKG